MKKALVMLCALSSLAMGEYAEYGAKKGTAFKHSQRAAAPQTKMFGLLELRPGWDTLKGDVASENSAQVGVAFDAVKASYWQDFVTASVNSETPMSPGLDDGHFKFRFDGLWKNDATSFSDEFRVYVPTNSSDRENGMVTVFRNYFILSQTVSPILSFAIIEVPILHVYSSKGSVQKDNSLAANPIFENRIIVELEANLSKTVKFSFPLHFYTKKYQDYDPKAAKNDEWNPSMFIWPEVDWSVTANTWIGAAYRTNSFIKMGDEGTVGGDSGGMFQGVLGVSF